MIIWCCSENVDQCQIYEICGTCCDKKIFQQLYETSQLQFLEILFWTIKFKVGIDRMELNAVIEDDI